LAASCERVRIVGAKLQRLSVDRFGLLRPFQFAQAGAEIVPRIGESRLQFEGAAVAGLGLGEALEALERVAAIAVGLRELVLKRDCAIEKRKRLLESCLVEQCNSEVAERARIIGIDFQRAPPGLIAMARRRCSIASPSLPD
jgi:hypothetical protein